MQTQKTKMKNFETQSPMLKQKIDKSGEPAMLKYKI